MPLLLCMHGLGFTCSMMEVFKSLNLFADDVLSEHLLLGLLEADIKSLVFVCSFMSIHCNPSIQIPTLSFRFIFCKLVPGLVLDIHISAQPSWTPSFHLFIPKTRFCSKIWVLVPHLVFFAMLTGIILPLARYLIHASVALLGAAMLAAFGGLAPVSCRSGRLRYFSGRV